VFAADAELVEIAVEASQAAFPDASVQRGLMVSADQFISGNQRIDLLRRYPGALSTGKESAAIAKVASFNELPFAIVRLISDTGDGTSLDFVRFVHETGIRSTVEVARELLRRMP
jgi:adenosylhomocysteine nucleosidase